MSEMKEFKLYVADSAFEYFCLDCKQLRLNLTGSETCGNCGSKNIIKGEVGELNKEELLDKHKE